MVPHQSQRYANMSHIVLQSYPNQNKSYIFLAFSAMVRNGHQPFTKLPPSVATLRSATPCSVQAGFTAATSIILKAMPMQP